MKKLIVVVITLFTVGCAVSLEARLGKKKNSTSSISCAERVLTEEKLHAALQYILDFENCLIKRGEE